MYLSGWCVEWVHFLGSCEASGVRSAGAAHGMMTHPPYRRRTATAVHRLVPMQQIQILYYGSYIVHTYMYMHACMHEILLVVRVRRVMNLVGI